MHRAAAVALASAACGRVDFSPIAADGAPDVMMVPPGFCATATFPNAATSTFIDDFSMVPFTDRWRTAGPCITQGANELVSAPPNTGDYCHAWTRAELHLTCDAVMVHVPEVTASLLGVQTFIYVKSLDDAIEFVVILEAGGFQMGPEGQSIAQSDFDTTRDAWWRLREHEGVITFDTAPDGLAWSTRMEMPRTFSTDRVEIAIGAGTYMPVSGGGQARFRCFNVPPPCM